MVVVVELKNQSTIIHNPIYETIVKKISTHCTCLPFARNTAIPYLDFFTIRHFIIYLFWSFVLFFSPSCSFLFLHIAMYTNLHSCHALLTVLFFFCRWISRLFSFFFSLFHNAKRFFPLHLEQRHLWS